MLERFVPVELNTIYHCRAPDPRFLYDDIEGKSRTRKQASYDDNQVVSIHKINLNHYKFSRKSVVDTIKYIVDKYNGESKKEGKKNRFKRMEIRYEPAVKEEDEKYFEGDDFHVDVYVQKVAKTISLLSSYGITEKATTIHSLIFHHRPNELFAITTNQSWNVVQWCSDFEFPGKVAARILSKEGQLESTNKGLVGTELTRKTTHKQQKKTNPYDLITFCTKFVAELRDNASILKLSCFQRKSTNRVSPVVEVESEDENGIEDEVQVVEPCSTIKRVKVAVSLGNIRILKRFSTSDILSILSVLSEISNGRETVNFDGEKELNSSAHKRYLTPVHTAVAKQLNVSLSVIIHDAIVDDNKMAELDNYQFCHKHTTDFFSGFDFQLLYKGKFVKQFTEIPTVKQIVVELRHDLGEIGRETSEKDFYKLLNHAKISYAYGNSNIPKKQEKVMNFIDGLMYHSRDNSVYWHVNAIWCHVQDAYLYLVHEQFRKILTYLLTDKTDPGYLNVPWPKHRRNENASPDKKLENYLKNYYHMDDTWTSEKSGHDIVDMIKIGKDMAGKNVFFVYYFLPGPNYQTNIKCNHVAESIMQIGKANRRMINQTQGGNDDVAGSEDVRKQLDVVYRKVSQKRQFKNCCPDSNQFVKMMVGAKFYLMIGRDNSTIDVPSLAKEKEMTTKISTDCIAGILENMIDRNQIDDAEMINETARILNEPFDKSRCSQLAESIHRQLRQSEYIEAQGNSIRGKLLSQSKNNFDLTDNSKVNEFLYRKIISNFQPKACTVLSKLAFIEMREEISKLTIKSFNLIEIPMQE